MYNFTKFPCFYPTETMPAAAVITKFELEKSAFSRPFRISSARGAAFTSKEFTEFSSKNIYSPFDDKWLIKR